MDKRYELYCLADRLFYDSPAARLGAEGTFPAATRPLPAGWHRLAADEWVVCVPAEPGAPAQGWKVHVSACLDNASTVVDTVWDYCTGSGVSFKFLRGRLALHLRNAKYASRGASGKLLTLYPADESHLETILHDLNTRLEGQPGPYILSDLRYGHGPLYVRYGGFTARFCEDERGESVPALADGSGRLVPDVRGPAFTVPGWVRLPAFLQPHLDARNSVTIGDLPYVVEKPLHFSNGGGVYLATDTRSGETVVLKEGRPHAGLSADGADAVARLHRERDILEHLSGVEGVPRVRDHFERGDHHFLVLDYVSGRPLNSYFATDHPLIGPAAPPRGKLAEYTAWAMKVCAGVERVCAAIHDRGVVINDLHMSNVMVRPDGSTTLIDFEVAAHTWEQRRPTIGNAGFLAPADRTGVDIDRYSLGCLRLAVFLPLTSLFSLEPGKATQLAGEIAARFPVPGEFLDQALADITGRRSRASESGRARFSAGRRALGDLVRAGAAAVRASATPTRDDRLFPGDILQFSNPAGGLSLGYGAAGVLYALAAAGQGTDTDHEEWLVSHSTHPPRDATAGLYDGLLGTAYVLHHLGHSDAALKTASGCLDGAWETLGNSLHSGLPGVALVLMHLGDALGEPALAGAGERALRTVAERAVAHHTTGPAGLMHGMSGPALLFVRAFERSGDTAYLDLAAGALHRDLDRCVTSPGGALQVDEGWRVMPYLSSGSVGIGMVAQEYLRHRPDERLAAAMPGIRLAALSHLYAQSGLFSGRAGMVFYLGRQTRPAAGRTGRPAVDPDVAAHVRSLAWHAVRYGDGLAFPGDQNQRLSMDLATGTAGVLFSLAVAADPTVPGLPFLCPWGTSATATDLPGHPRGVPARPLTQRGGGKS